jgi:hypothetical protein
LSGETLYRFEMWATSRPIDPYYVTNWDRKQKVTVVAPDRHSAYAAAATALGNAGERRHWVFRVVSVTDHRIPVESGEAR